MDAVHPENADVVAQPIMQVAVGVRFARRVVWTGDVLMALVEYM